MKIAILGGSFNPPHIGHVFVTQYILTTSEVDQLWFLPCYRHAFGKILEPFHHRLEMCTLAVASFRENLVQVLPLEKERQGTSWTIDTVRYVKQRYPEFDLTWVIGSDVLRELDKWKDFDQLQTLISFLVVPRAGDFNRTSSSMTGHAPLWKENRVVQKLKYQCQELEEQGIVLPNISSSFIRQRVQQHQSIHHLVPRAVEEYIYTHMLYQSD